MLLILNLNLCNIKALLFAVDQVVTLNNENITVNNIIIEAFFFGFNENSELFNAWKF